MTKNENVGRINVDEKAPSSLLRRHWPFRAEERIAPLTLDKTIPLDEVEGRIRPYGVPGGPGESKITAKAAARLVTRTARDCHPATL